MSNQQLEQALRDQLKFKLKVKHEAKPTTLINTAQLISKDLRVKVKDSSVLFETQKKAWLVEQIEISENKMISTIIQETKSKSWVAFEIVHEKDVEIKDTWSQIKRVQRDIKIMMYPMWFIISIMGLVEILLVKKTLFDKEIIILSSDDWRVIMWISIAVIGWFLLLFYYANKLMLHEGYFQSIGTEFHSERTLDFYMLSTRLKRTFTLRYTLTITCFRGYYSHPDKPEKIPFKKKRAKIKEVEESKQEYLLARDDLRILQEEDVRISEEIEELRIKERETNIQQQIKQKELQKEKNNEDLEKEHIEDLEKLDPLTFFNESDDAFKMIKTLRNEKRAEQSAIQVLIDYKKKTAEEKRVVYQKNLEDIYAFDEEVQKKYEIEKLIEDHQLSRAIRAENANLRNRLIHTTESLAGIYDTMSQYQDTENQRVAEESARKTSTSYSYEIVGQTEEGEMTIPSKIPTGTATTAMRAKAGVGLNAGLIQILAVMLGFAGMVFAIIEMVKALSMASPLVIIISIVSIPVGLLIIYKLINMAIQYFTHSQTSVRVT